MGRRKNALSRQYRRPCANQIEAREVVAIKSAHEIAHFIRVEAMAAKCRGGRRHKSAVRYGQKLEVSRAAQGE